MKKLSLHLLSLAFLLMLSLPAFTSAQFAAPPSGPSGPSQPSPTGPSQPSPSGPSQPSPSAPVDVKITLENPFKDTVGNNLYDLLKAVLDNIIIPIGGILCVLAFIYAGFRYVTAGGSDTKIKDAHNALLYAAIGTAVLLGAKVITEVVYNTVMQIVK